MKTLTLRGHVKADGILDLRIPTDMPESDVEVTVQLRKTEQNPEKRTWPDGFIERTAGAFRDDLIHRPPQGDYEVREEII